MRVILPRDAPHADWILEALSVVRAAPRPDRWAERMVSEVGLPIGTIARWKRARRDMTAGLKRRVKENVN